jgi:recombination protein RecA
VVKNKVAAPFKQCEFDILYGTGISREGSLLDMATEMEIVQKSGTWFSYGKERIGQGREKARDYLKENKAMAAEIEDKIRQTIAAGLADSRSGLGPNGETGGKGKSSGAGEEDSWDNIEIASQGEG